MIIDRSPLNCSKKMGCLFIIVHLFKIYFRVCVCVCMYTYVYVCVCIYVCACVCVCDVSNLFVICYSFVCGICIMFSSSKHVTRSRTQINNLRLCSNLINTVNSSNFPPLVKFTQSQTVAYQFYVGRLLIFDEKFAEVRIWLIHAHRYIRVCVCVILCVMLVVLCYTLEAESAGIYIITTYSIMIRLF